MVTFRLWPVDPFGGILLGSDFPSCSIDSISEQLWPMVVAVAVVAAIRASFGFARP